MSVEIPHLYLVSAQFDTDGNIQKGSARPIGNTFITLENQHTVIIPEDQDLETISKTEIKKQRQLYLTDAHGSISNFVSGKNSENISQAEEQAFSISTNAELLEKADLYMPPAHLVQYSFAANGYENWLPEFHKQLDTIIKTNKENSPTLELDTRLVDVDTHFENPESSASVDYKKWYKTNEGLKVRALCLPRVRAFMVRFSDSRYLDAEVKITNRQGQQVFYADSGKVSMDARVVELTDLDETVLGYGAIFFDVDNHFDPSADSSEHIYQFTIKPEEDKLEVKSSDNSYKLVERLRFPIKNNAGDFDVINGDAFSLEECLVRQFPLRFPNIIKNISDQQNNPDPIKGTESLLHAITTNQDKLKIIGGAYTADSTASLLRVLGLGFYNSVPVDSESALLLRGSINLAFSVYDLGKETIKAKNKVIQHYTNEASEVARRIARDHALNIITEGVPPSNIWLSAVADDVDEVIDDLHELPLPTKLQKVFKASQTITDKLGKGMDVYSAFNDVQGVFVAYDKMESSIGDTNKIFTDYAYKVHFNDMESKDTNKLTRQEIEDSKGELVSFQKEHKETSQVSQVGDVTFINVTFAFDRAGFTKDDSFDGLVSFLKSIRLPFDLTLAGHTCNIGTASYNLELSRRRALSVEKILLDAGIGESATVNISIQAFGESKPVVDNEAGEENRKKNRRVDAVIALKKVGRFKPSREGIESIEKYRALSSIHTAEMGDSMSKAVVSTLDLIAGIPPTNFAHLAFSLLWSAAGVLSDGANLLNDAVFGKAFLKATTDFNQHDRLSAANQALLLEGTEINKNINAGYYLETQVRLRAEALNGLMQLLMRCSIETDNITSRLKFDIDNVKDTRTSFSYADNLKFYRVNEYVQTYILSDGWKLFSGALHPVALDDYWLYLIKTSDLEAKVKSTKNEGWQDDELVRVANYANDTFSYLDLVKDNIIDSAGDLMLAKRFISNNVLTLFHKERDYLTTARFQEFFPIHYTQSDSLEELFIAAKPDFSDLDEDIYLGMMHSVKEAGDSSSAWTSMSTWLGKSSGSKRAWISPLDEIRVCILLDPESGIISKYIEDGTISYLPYKVFPTRVDGLDMSAPANDGFIGKLKYDDLTPDEKKLLGDHKKEDVKDKLYGAIVYPYFNLGKKKIHGTKPLAGSVSAWLNVTSEHTLGGIYNSDYRWDMRYKYEVMLGYNTETLKNICYKKKVTTGRMKRTYYPYEFPYAICDSEKSPYKGESTLLDRHFLQVGIGEKEVTPPLFVNPDVFCVLNSNIKDGKYHYSNKNWYEGSKPPSNVKLNTGIIDSISTSVLSLPEFNWEDEVEVVVLVVCDSLDDKAYDKRLMKTDSIPAQVQLLREGVIVPENIGMHAKYATPHFSAKLFDGPKYDTALQPLGNIVKSRVSGLEFEWSKEVAGDDFSQLEAHLSESSTLEMLSGIRPDIEDTDDKTEEGSGSLAGFVQDAISDKVDDTMDSVADSWDSFMGNAISKPVYAARIVLNYQDLLGSMRNGIKPFAVNPFDLFNEKSEGTKNNIWKLRLRVTSAGDSGVAGIIAQGEYELPYPQGLASKKSHWYKRDEKDFLSAKKITKNDKKFAKEDEGKDVFGRRPAHPITPLMQWVMNDNGMKDELSDKQKKSIGNWLLKQGDRKVLSMTEHEVMK
jgi:outer membrane protein OmpA-like peptidoglycan-associated protein